jgi:hypothetical protein
MIADAAITPPDFSMLLAYGPLGLVFAVLLYFVVYYGPSIFKGHIDTMACFRESSVKNAEWQARQTIALESLTQTASIHATDCKRTHKALGHIAEAGKLVMPQGVAAADAHRHLDKVIAIRDGDE